MTPGRYARLLAALACAAAAAGCGGSGGGSTGGTSGPGGGPGGGPSGARTGGPARTPPATVATGRDVAVGELLAWRDDGSLLTSTSDGEGRSTHEPCPSPQPRFEIRLNDVAQPDGGDVVAADPRLFEPVIGRVSPDGAWLAVIGYCAEEFVGAVNLVHLAGDGTVVALPLSAGVTYASPFNPATTLDWVSATELLVHRMTYAGAEKWQREAVVVDVTTMRERVVASGPDLVAARALPDGAFLTLTGEGRSFAVELLGADGRRRKVGTASYAAAAPDGSRVALWDAPDDDAGPGTRVRLVPLAGGEPANVAVPGEVVAVTWSPRSDRVLLTAAGEEDDEVVAHVYVAGADGSGLRELALAGYDEDGSVAWSPDGRLVAYGTGESIRLAAV